MNSMNFFSTIGTATPPLTNREPFESAETSASTIGASNINDDIWSEEGGNLIGIPAIQDLQHADNSRRAVNEKTPLLHGVDNKQSIPQGQSRPAIMKRMTAAIIGSLKVLISTLLAPGQYVIACFFDEQGKFSALLPMYKVGRLVTRRPKKANRSEMTFNGHQKEISEYDDSEETRRKTGRSSKRSNGTPSSNIEDEHDLEPIDDSDTPSKNTRSQSTITDGDGDQAPKRSIRIKVLNEDALRQRKQRRDQSVHLTAAAIKSPTSPTSSLGLTKYPRPPALPRPLIPRRQPSYSSAVLPVFGTVPSSQKTLIIDLDETLIHSMAKGGRMSTGHMVEVKLQNPVLGGTVIGPQVPILYYVHKRPHCDEFLRKVSKWYNLVIFTASVQEYADPVIDWLELERKYFSKRYYRQHCTYRNGAYIKDLGHIEPNLSNAIILDNSPLSYAFHQDNAVPIEGWISDPTDNDLLHLIPFFEGLQYTTDVRSLLALRQGESSN